eukprot:scaffold238298_cov20-Cyclotella_meneghiniana.AAC.1
MNLAMCIITTLPRESRSSYACFLLLYLSPASLILASVVENPKITQISSFRQQCSALPPILYVIIGTKAVPQT